MLNQVATATRERCTNQDADWASCEPVRSDAIKQLLTRHSVGPRHLVRPAPDHPRVPPHEQWLAAGGALSNFLTALHIMGFGAKMLSGRKAADPFICDAFCEPGETLVGWIAVGTASKAPHPRHNDSPDTILRRWQPPNKLRDPRIITPTGHFNVHNTTHDVY